jgi:hypothetical protein
LLFFSTKHVVLDILEIGVVSAHYNLLFAGYNGRRDKIGNEIPGSSVEGYE